MLNSVSMVMQTRVRMIVKMAKKYCGS